MCEEDDYVCGPISDSPDSNHLSANEVHSLVHLPSLLSIGNLDLAFSDNDHQKLILHPIDSLQIDSLVIWFGRWYVYAKAAWISPSTSHPQNPFPWHRL